MFKKILSDSVIYGASRVLMMAVSMFLVPIYSRMFTKADYGVVETFNSLTNIVTLFLTTGILQAVYLVYYNLDEKEKKKYYSTTYFYLCGISILLLAITYFFSNPITKFIIGSNQYNRIFLLSIIIICSSSTFSYLQEISRSQFKKLTYVILSVGNALMLASLGVLFVVFLKKGVVGFFYASLISQVVFLSVSSIVNWGNITFYFSPKLLKQILWFSLPFLPAMLGSMFLKYVDRIVIQKFMGLDDLGLYSMSLRISNIFDLIGFAFSTAWFPWAIKMSKEEGAKPFFSSMFDNVMIMFCVLCGLFGSVQIFIIKIIVDHKFFDAYQYVYLLAFSSILQYASYVLGIGLNVSQKTKYISIPTIASGAINLAVCIPLVKYYGIAGVNVSLIVAALTYTGVYYYLSNKFYPVQYNFSKNITLTVALFGWLVALYFIDRQTNTAIALNIGLKTACVAAFAILVLLLNPDLKRRVTALTASFSRKK